MNKKKKFQVIRVLVMASKCVDNKTKSNSDDFPKFCEYGCGKYFEIVGNNVHNYLVHTKHCKRRPKKQRNDLFKYYSSTDKNNDHTQSANDQQAVAITDLCIGDGDDSESLTLQSSSEKRECEGFKIKFGTDFLPCKIY